MRTAKSCGPDAPMAGVKFSGSSRFLGATVTNKLWSRRGEHGISRKPSRREGRIASAEPVCSCAFLFVHVCTRDRGCSAHPVFPAPSLEGRAAPSLLRANEFVKLGQTMSREGRIMSEASSMHDLSCPGSSRASTSYFERGKDVDSRDKPRHDDQSAVRKLNRKFDTSELRLRILHYDEVNTLTPPNAVMRPPFSITIWVAS
jgi:hypothetical protein